MIFSFNAVISYVNVCIFIHYFWSVINFCDFRCKFWFKSGFSYRLDLYYQSVRATCQYLTTALKEVYMSSLKMYYSWVVFMTTLHMCEIWNEFYTVAYVHLNNPLNVYI